LYYGKNGYKKSFVPKSSERSFFVLQRMYPLISRLICQCSRFCYNLAVGVEKIDHSKRLLIAGCYNSLLTVGNKNPVG